MAMNHTEVEQMMRDLGCDGDKITSALIESRIVDVDYETVVIAGQKLMYCGIRMDNGFVVVGKPATCIDPANWRDEIGRKISYDNAFSEIWRLEEKLNDGWVHGDVKDAVARCHPCVTAYENLPQEQRSKDYLFKAVVTALS